MTSTTNAPPNADGLNDQSGQSSNNSHGPKRTIRIAIDAMGGDFGLAVTVPAAADFLAEYPHCELLIVGRPGETEHAIAAAGLARDPRVQFVAASEVVGMDEDVRQAIRGKKDSSMRVAINTVKDRRSDACLSAGNTGALMGTAKFVLKMLPGIDRPAICFALPSRKQPVYALDLGANVDCTAEHLLQFAIMGAMVCEAVEGKPNPSVGLLNNGSEAIKGNEVVKRAGELLRQSHLNFYGNVEGTDVFKGVTDVVVCDGFVGNIMLKSSEGIAKMMGDFLKAEFLATPFSKVAGLIAKPVLTRFKNRVDPSNFNGAMLLGLQGIVVKSHGSADRVSFKNALIRTCKEAEHNVVELIAGRIAELDREGLLKPREATSQSAGIAASV